jgi:hypothetical protein
MSELKPALVSGLMNCAVKRAFLVGAAAFAVSGIARAETTSPRQLLEVADLANPVISPDGKSVAFRLERASVERNTYDTIWYVVGIDGKAPPRPVADGGVPLRDSAGTSLPATAVWSPDGRWIYYRAVVAGKIDVWRAAADGSDAEAITNDAADVRDFSLSADGRTLDYSVGATREEVTRAEIAEYDRGIRVDENTPIGQPLFRSGNIEAKLATQRYGPVWFDRVPLLAGTPSRWQAIDLKTRKVRQLAASYKPASEVSYKPAVVVASENSLPGVWKFEIEPGRERLALLKRIGDAPGLRDKPDVELAMLPSRDARTPVRCRDPLCTNKAISAIQWRPDSDEVLFTVSDPHEGLAQSIYRWNVRTGAVHLVVRSSGLLNGGRDESSPCGVSSDSMICVAASADQPPRLERIDLATGRRQLLFDPNASLAQAIKAQVPARLLRWTDRQGQEFTGQFFAARSPNGAATPLFITYYSCTGFLRGGVGDEWPLESLADEGISALCINHPPGYVLDGVARYNQALSGVKSAIDLLASAGTIDRSKVGMGGLSFGSEVTFWTEMYSDVLAAASVTSIGITSDYYLFGSMKGKVFFDGLKQVYQLGPPEATPERWKTLSVESNLDTIRAPILMQMPEQEYMYALNYAIPLIRAHRADLYVFPNEPHQKFQPRHKLAAYERNLDWFRFWLQGYEDTNPVKIEQYSHWQEMRVARAEGAAAPKM